MTFLANARTKVLSSKLQHALHLRRVYLNPIISAAMLAALATLLLLSFSTRTQAWVAWFDRCNGSDVKWRGDFDVHRNSHSIPDTGDVNTAYWNGINQWNSYSDILQSDDFYVNPPSDTKYDKANNGENEVSLVNRSEIDGADGKTFADIGICFIGSNDIDEMDTVVANDMAFWPDWGNDISKTEGNYGRTAFVHEFGHFFGFDHSSWCWTQMTPVGMGTITGGNQAAAVFADDSMGMKSFYGMTGTKANLMTSATRISNGTVTTLDPAQVRTVCRNSQQTINFYIGNSGEAATGTYSGRVRMSKTSPFSGYTQSTSSVLTFSHSLSAFTEGTFQMIFTVPRSLGDGTYYIYIEVDTGGVVSEFHESDNHTLSATRLKLTSSC